MKIFVTGASGFLGKEILKYGIKKGYKIDGSTTRKVKGLYQFKLNETTDFSFLKNIDVLIHCAFDTKSRTYEHLFNVNYEGTKSLFLNARKYKVKKIFYISTITAGSGNERSNYAKVKYEIEQFSKSLLVYIIRPGMICSWKNEGGIFKRLNNIVARLKIIPLPNSKIKPSFIYTCILEELIIELYKLITLDNYENKIINFASEKPIYFNDLIKLIKQKKKSKNITFTLHQNFFYFLVYLCEKLSIGNFTRDSLKTILGNQKADLRFFIKKFKFSPLSKK
jgi:nucleoside-diphosphate-sugar epimerase